MTTVTACYKSKEKVLRDEEEDKIPSVPSYRTHFQLPPLPLSPRLVDSSRKVDCLIELVFSKMRICATSEAAQKTHH